MIGGACQFPRSAPRAGRSVILAQRNGVQVGAYEFLYSAPREGGSVIVAHHNGVQAGACNSHAMHRTQVRASFSRPQQHAGRTPRTPIQCTARRRERHFMTPCRYVPQRLWHQNVLCAQAGASREHLRYLY